MLYKYYNHFEEIIYEGGNAGILTVVLCAEVEKDFAKHLLHNGIFKTFKIFSVIEGVLFQEFFILKGAFVSENTVNYYLLIFDEVLHHSCFFYVK